MPQNKTEDLVFSIIMVVLMVYCMTVYNISLEMGLSYGVFLIALKSMWVEAIIAFFAQRYIAGPVSKKLLPRILTPGQDKQIFILIAMAGFNVAIMAPFMTLCVNIYHHGFVSDIFILWLGRLVYNFPMALILQIFYIGPLVRLIFRTIFRREPKKRDKALPSA